MRNTLLVFTGAVVVAAFFGCSSSPGIPDCGDLVACTTSAGGAAPTTSASGSTTTGGMGGAGGAASASSASAASSTASASGSTGTGSGTSCGGKLGKKCLDTEYCDFPADACSLADETGSCVARPVGCPDLYAPTCACDGMVYGNACDAAAAGVDINLNGLCPPPTGKFSCGAAFCDVGISYCERDTSDVGGVPSTYTCKPLPPSCGDPSSCACLANVPCGSICAASPDGAGQVVTCPGG
ncbi:MAG: hypothetical protein ABJE95_06980 [Byssovorax sp.]